MSGFRYVHNNIFFSFAVDADLEQLSRKQSSDSNLNSSEKVLTKLASGAAKVIGDKSSENHNVNGAVESTSDAPSEAQLAESEQATYASSNNDLKGTKAYQEADVPGLYNLAMAIVDYRGHRVVAQVHILSVTFTKLTWSIEVVRMVGWVTGQNEFILK